MYTLNNDIFVSYDDFDEACQKAIEVARLTREDVIIRKDFKPFALARHPNGEIEMVPEGCEHHVKQQKHSEGIQWGNIVKESLIEALIKNFSKKK